MITKETKKDKLVIDKSKFPDKDGNYVLFHYSETKRGSNWRGIFKGTKKECLEYKLNLINDKI